MPDIIISAMQSKATMRNHLPLVSLLPERPKIADAGEGVKQRERFTLLLRIEVSAANVANRVEILQRS